MGNQGGSGRGNEPSVFQSSTCAERNNAATFYLEETNS